MSPKFQKSSYNSSKFSSVEIVLMAKRMEVIIASGANRGHTFEDQFISDVNDSSVGFKNDEGDYHINVISKRCPV